jgi:hypothetical protein
MQEKSSHRLDFLRRLDTCVHSALHNKATPADPPCPPLAESALRG